MKVKYSDYALIASVLLAFIRILFNDGLYRYAYSIFYLTVFAFLVIYVNSIHNLSIIELLLVFLSVYIPMLFIGISEVKVGTLVKDMMMMCFYYLALCLVSKLLSVLINKGLAMATVYMLIVIVYTLISTQTIEFPVFLVPDVIIDVGLLLILKGMKQHEKNE